MKELKNTLIRRLVFLLCILSLTGCESDTPKAGDIVARVGNQYLTRDLVISLTPKALQATDREAFIKRIVEQWIDNQVLAQKAIAEGIALTNEDKWQVDKLQAGLLGEKYITNRLSNNFSITDKDIEDYYRDNTLEFVRQHDEVHLVHVFFEQQDNAIFREIRQTKILMDVIKNNLLDQRQLTYVIEPNADLGYVAVNKLRPEFQKAIRGKKTGTIYGPIKTGDGFHFLQVLDRKAEGTTRRLELVEQQIVNHLRIALRHRKIRALKDDARKDMLIETFYQNVL